MAEFAYPTRTLYLASQVSGSAGPWLPEPSAQSKPASESSTSNGE